ncbi:MAG: glycosyltransferase family 4 protein [Ignavibacteriales bacterium]|nr:glycosyltransferase family 4 protein [Ignavibacteriales bacterium]
MVRFYYTSSSYIELDVKSPTIKDETYNKIDFIPYSTKQNIVKQGFIKRIDFEIDFVDETTFNSFMAVLDDIFKISIDGSKFYYASYDGSSFQKTMWAGRFSGIFSFILQGLQYSLTERGITADNVLPNTGNYEAEATFTISGGGYSILKISDGTREIVYTGTVDAGKTLIIQNWKAYVDGEEFSQNLSGDYPLIPANQDNFKFTITGTGASNVLVKYRDTWR